MTVIRPNSVSGINSITAQANEIKIFKSDGTQGGLIIGGANLNATSGISTVAALTVTGNVSVGGTLTYQDVTNIDSVGVITARAGVKVPDNQKVFLGTGDDLEIYHDGNSRVRHTGAGDLLLQSNSDVYIQRASDGHQMIIAENDGPVKLYYDNSEKFKTTSGGVEVSSGNLTMQSNGRIFVGNGGNAVNPMFANVSDTNTGIAFPAADTMMFTTGGSERLRIASDSTIHVNSPDSASGGRIYAASSKLYLQSGNGRQSVNIADMASGQSATHEFNSSGSLVLAGGMQAASVNLQSSNTNSWFQTGANYGGTDYVWAAKDSSANVWHSGLQTDGDLLLGGNISGTSYIQLNGSTGNATFIGKVTIGDSYGGGEIFKLGKSSGNSYLAHYNGGTAHGFIGHADQLVSGGAATDYAIRARNELLFATDGANERFRITSDGDLKSANINISGYCNTHNIDNYSVFLADNHANTFFGQNLRLDFSGTSGNHQLKVINQHSQIGGAGMLIGGNNSSYVNQIHFITVPANQSAGTRVDDTKRRLSIESSGRVVIHGDGTIRTSWPGAVCSVHNLAMMDAGSGFSWGLRANSGDTQWCLERISGNNSFSDSNIKFRVYNNGNYMFAGSNSSDRDIKENIEDISGTSLNLIDQLRPRTFNFKESEGYSTEPKTGFVAQEIGAVIPSIVNGTDGQKDMGVDYNGLVAHLVKAVQELKAENDSLRSRLDTAGL